MFNTKQFGPWKVEKVIKSRRGFEVSHPKRAKNFVLKKAGNPNEQASWGTSQKNLANEIKALQRVTDHPNIINLIDFSLDDDPSWHVTEKLDCRQVRKVNFDDWPIEELKPGNSHAKLEALLKALGYIHSKGIFLGGGIEILVTKDRRFVFCDFECCNIWDDHHLDTREDLNVICRHYFEIRKRLDQAYQKKNRARHSKREVERCHVNAQPSAPARLAAE